LQTQDDTAILATTADIPARFGHAPTVNGNSQATATPLAITTFPDTMDGPFGTRVPHPLAGKSVGTGTGLVIQPGVANFFNFTASAGAAAIIGKVSDSIKEA
jgi:hypothetical protein